MIIDPSQAQGSSNKPTHNLVIETEHGRLQVSLFANNKLHANLIAAFGDGTDISAFLTAVMTSAKIEKAEAKPSADADLVSAFRNLNVKA